MSSSRKTEKSRASPGPSIATLDHLDDRRSSTVLAYDDLDAPSFRPLDHPEVHRLTNIFDQELDLDEDTLRALLSAAAPFLVCVAPFLTPITLTSCTAYLS